jgi:hypothetical protein
MQCSRLVDEKDNLIYEGDILYDTHDKHYIVKYDENIYRLILFDVRNERVGGYILSTMSRQGLSLIGNIYENIGLVA